MFGITDFWLFVLSGLALNIIPGPDSLFIIGRSAGQGFKAGSVAALGIGTGTFVHIFAAAFGLAAILSTSAMAFTVIKIIGALYLLYIGVTMLMSKSQLKPVATTDRKLIPLSKIFYQGFLTNALNPKVALFFLAFVPQFISADAPNKALAFIVLGFIFNINGMLWCHMLAWTSSSVGKRLKSNEKLTLWLSKLTGGLFLYFGLKLALSDKS
ncbi:MAG: threonine/homoserine/homoserine lactone efflux protein [Alteromonadaceae bacterium]